MFENEAINLKSTGPRAATAETIQVLKLELGTDSDSNCHNILESSHESHISINSNLVWNGMKQQPNVVDFNSTRSNWPSLRDIKTESLRIQCLLSRSYLLQGEIPLASASDRFMSDCQ